MRLFVAGCHGGESPRHKTSGFVVREHFVDGVGDAAKSGLRSLAIDAGSLSSGLTIAEQCELDAVLVSHAHLDHIKDLASLSDNRCQAGSKPLEIVGTKATLDALRTHFFNDVLWPDFSKIPTGLGPTVIFREVPAAGSFVCGGFSVRAIPVSHTIDASGFLVTSLVDGTSFAYSGDTGPTEALYEVLEATPKLKLLLLEVSFPNHQEVLAHRSGHYTPELAARDLKKLAFHRHLPTLIYHLKPVFEAQIERELSKLQVTQELAPLRLGDEIVV